MAINQIEEIEASDISINEEMPFQRREWRVQRAAWYLAIAIIVSAMLGVFGAGPISTASHRSPSGALEIEYQRFTRWQSPVTLVLRCHAQPEERVVRVWFARDFFKTMQAQFITPPPARSITDARRIIYEFAAGENAPFEMRFQFNVERFGLVRGEVGLPGDDPIHFWQFVYP